jgi:hypothetical protein
LRWRILRQDSLDGVCWLPEFLRLCESDPVLFLRWEMRQKCGSDEPEQLSRLGITASFHTLPQLLYEFLLSQSEPSRQLSLTLVPFFARISFELVKIPEYPNLILLFQLDELWWPQILNHPKVIEALRNPPFAAAQSLLTSLRNHDDYEKLFTDFPHAFAAMLFHFVDLTGPKPRCLCDAQLFLTDGHSPTMPIPPHFAIVSIVFVAIKTGKKDVLELINAVKTDEWCRYCLFFTICFKQYQNAIEILKSHRFLFRFLKESVQEELLFAGPRKWADSLIEFTIFCADTDVSFAENIEWRAFLEVVRIADWPDTLQLDNENFRLLERYQARFV